MTVHLRPTTGPKRLALLVLGYTFILGVLPLVFGYPWWMFLVGLVLAEVLLRVVFTCPVCGKSTFRRAPPRLGGPPCSRCGRGEDK
jgi:hypothetical protein